MQYAAHLPSSRSMIAPIVALAIGAAGAAGLYAALEVARKTAEELGRKADIAVLSKLYPSRSHTGAAQGGSSAGGGPSGLRRRLHHAVILYGPLTDASRRSRSALCCYRTASKG